MQMVAEQAKAVGIDQKGAGIGRSDGCLGCPDAVETGGGQALGTLNQDFAGLHGFECGLEAADDGDARFCVAG